mmetsp:Transcript_19033/g.39883  ORF Transcript_19033/g.39883 Transcript_19033/m.39883 type:complete len:542 (-) Transcript_19033:463-2088(-)
MKTVAVLKGLLTLLVVQKVSCQECAANGVCDSHKRCSIWKDEGECYRSLSYMKRVCPVSCRNIEKAPRRNECKDIHENCVTWVETDECETNSAVVKYCPLSCQKCKMKTAANNNGERMACKDGHQNCQGWADMGECDNNPVYMLENCRKACDVCEITVTSGIQNNTKTGVNDLVQASTKFGVVQSVAEGNHKQATLDTMQKMMDYLDSNEYTSLPSKIKKNCKNNNELCAFWAAIGECEKNISFMKVQCAPACQSCHLIDIDNRCPALPDAVPALKEGDLNKLFERIVESAPGNRTLTVNDRQELAKLEMPEYSVKVHSRPSDGPGTEINIESDKNLRPWVITFDNLLTDEECDALIQHGYDAGYKRSEDVGKRNFDGTHDSKKSKGRTSENAWCSTRNECRGKTVPKRVLDRLSSIMGIPFDNSEDLQILKYETGQYYNTHHDYIPYQKDRQCGPRILTFFLYLSDVEAGGGTDFPDLGITVMPKKGRAVLWPSVYNAQPLYEDSRMMHQALPVVAGTKFGANVWVHMYDYLGPLAHGCD